MSGQIIDRSAVRRGFLVVADLDGGSRVAMAGLGACVNLASSPATRIDRSPYNRAPMPAVSFQQVEKTYSGARGTFRALDGVSFNIEQGEFFGAQLSNYWDGPPSEGTLELWDVWEDGNTVAGARFKGRVSGRRASGR